MYTKHRHIRYYDFFIENVSENDQILDIGSGNGFLSYDLVTNVKNVKLFGIDINKKSIENARNKYNHPNLRFLVEISGWKRVNRSTRRKI
ncbi:MAG: methyltransferase domain-containing protein [Candidatus Hodarchaeota archaeon]